MRLKTLLLQKKKQQKSYLEYLEGDAENLSHAQKLKLCKEITRLQHHIDHINEMPLAETQKDRHQPLPIEAVAQFRKPRPRPTKHVPYTFSTWRRLQ